jgi:hypothetical protein
MTFTTGTYLLFLPAVVLLTFRVRPDRRWIVLLAAGYVFYASLGLEYLVALLWVTANAYLGGLLLARSAPNPGDSERLQRVTSSRKVHLALFILLTSASLLVLK